MRDLLERYWTAHGSYDLDVLATLRHPEWVAEWPQSGELIRGHEMDRAIHENYPGGYPDHQLRRGVQGAGEWAYVPLVGPTRISEVGRFAIVEARLSYPDGSHWFTVALVDVRDGLVGRETVYFAEPFVPPEWRKQWVELVPESEPYFGSLNAGAGEEDIQRAAVASYGALLEQGDLSGAAVALYHDDAAEYWPQSGERVVGLNTIQAVVANHPARPRGRVARVSGPAGLLATEIELSYGGEQWHDVALLEFRGDRVARRTDYFARPLDAPGWRAQWVERT